MRLTILTLTSTLLLCGPAPAGTAEGTAAPAAAPAPEPVPPVFPMTRVVPKGEARMIGFFASLFPDCSTQGPTVVRVLAAPKHGRVDFAAADSFPRYGAGSPLVACNTKRVPGLKMVYEAEEGFEGIDTYRIFVINPDGTGFESEVKVSVR
ncbi:hypothetical protein [Methylobacterium planeticum]|uniref:Uncharacterized protein n=1 Tax=Methylobacterium planeticum TaxID=2615211 RepID=A0A6N6MTR3_9HYPH|nr:hypothetical protein [Methylobacterium planeticum]KAB1073132.1 hypothetical protein F6X51_12295 [Methylobacterium planeticum]